MEVDVVFKYKFYYSRSQLGISTADDEFLKEVPLKCVLQKVKFTFSLHSPAALLSL